MPRQLAAGLYSSFHPPAWRAKGRCGMERCLYLRRFPCGSDDRGRLSFCLHSWGLPAPFDRYFLTVPALEKLAALNGNREVHMEIVTKAKRSCVAFEKPAPHKAGRGRPPKKGPAVRQQELFLSHKEDYRMYFPGTEAADRGIVLPVLVKAYAQSGKIQKFRFSHKSKLRRNPNFPL